MLPELLPRLELIVMDPDIFAITESFVFADCSRTAPLLAPDLDFPE
jgi:hypothetical protein